MAPSRQPGAVTPAPRGERVPSARCQAHRLGRRDRGLRAGPSGLQDPEAEVGWSRPPVCRCSHPSPRGAATQLGDARVPRSPHSPALISAAARSRVVWALRSRCFCPQVPRLPARRAARPPARLSAPACPQRRRSPAARPPLPAPPRRPRPAPRPRPSPAPRRFAGGAHPGKCRRRSPAAPPSRPDPRRDGLQSRQAARPAHAQAGDAAAASRSHSWVSAELSTGPGWRPGWRRPASGETGGRVRSKLGAALVESCICKGSTSSFPSPQRETEAGLAHPPRRGLRSQL